MVERRMKYGKNEKWEKYGWEKNEGEMSLWRTMLPTGIKIATDKILQTACSKFVSTQCNKNKCSCVRAGLNCSEFCDCQQSNDQIDMHMDDNEIADKTYDSKSWTKDE